MVTPLPQGSALWLSNYYGYQAFNITIISFIGHEYATHLSNAAYSRQMRGRS